MTPFTLHYWHRYPQCEHLHRHLMRIEAIDSGFIVEEFNEEICQTNLGSTYLSLSLGIAYRQSNQQIKETATFVCASDKDNGDRPLPCKGCNFYHGKQGVVCAVHPEGVSAATCSDWEEAMQ